MRVLPDEDRAKKVEKWELALRNAIEAGLESAALDILKQTEENISRRPSKEVTSRRSSKNEDEKEEQEDEATGKDKLKQIMDEIKAKKDEAYAAALAEKKEGLPETRRWMVEKDELPAVPAVPCILTTRPERHLARIS